MSIPGLRHLIVLVLLFSFAYPIAAQSPYQLKAAQEAAYIAAPAAVFGLSYAIQPRLHALSTTQIAGLNITQIPRFERFVTKNYNLKSRKASDYLLYSSALIPLALLADKQVRSDFKTASVLGFELVLSSVALTQITKELAHRTRPYAYNPDVPMSEKLKRDTRLSLFSGHTSTSAAIAFGAAKIWSGYHPGSRWKPLVWTGAALLPATVGILRVGAGKHFVSDVVLGYAVGAACGWLVPYFHRKS
ncbi:MAG: phosphatase PAP2 family protein [Bacteroidota bacterium]